MADLNKLRVELSTDPLGRGYAGMSDEAAAASLNAEDRNRNRSTMTGREVMDAVDIDAFEALDANQRSQFLALTASENLDPFGLPARIVINLFGGASATVTALAAARVETVSRAEELNLGDVTVAAVKAGRA